VSFKHTNTIVVHLLRANQKKGKKRNLSLPTFQNKEMRHPSEPGLFFLQPASCDLQPPNDVCLENRANDAVP
jgi:hypothetical protein